MNFLAVYNMEWDAACSSLEYKYKETHKIKPEVWIDQFK